MERHGQTFLWLYKEHSTFKKPLKATIWHFDHIFIIILYSIKANINTSGLYCNATSGLVPWTVSTVVWLNYCEAPSQRRPSELVVFWAPSFLPQWSHLCLDQSLLHNDLSNSNIWIVSSIESKIMLMQQLQICSMLSMCHFAAPICELVSDIMLTLCHHC